MDYCAIKPVLWNRTMTKSPEQVINNLKVSILAYGEKPGQTTHIITQFFL